MPNAQLAHPIALIFMLLLKLTWAVMVIVVVGRQLVVWCVYCSRGKPAFVVMLVCVHCWCYAMLNSIVDMAAIVIVIAIADYLR